MGLEFPNATNSSYSFHLRSIKLHEDLGHHGGIQAGSFLGNWRSFKNFVWLWYVNMGVNGKIVKCVIPWKRLTVEQNGCKFGTHGLRNSICRVIFGWGHLNSKDIQKTVKTFKRLLLTRCSSNFNQTLQTACTEGKIGYCFFSLSAKL